MLLRSTDMLLVFMAILGCTKPVDILGDSEVSQCVRFPLILRLPIIKGFRRRCLDTLNYLESGSMALASLECLVLLPQLANWPGSGLH